MLKKVYTMIFLGMICVLFGNASYAQEITPVNSFISDGMQRIVHTELREFDETSALLGGKVALLAGRWNKNSDLYSSDKCFVFWEQDKPEEKTTIRNNLILFDNIYPDLFRYRMTGLKPGTKYCFQAMSKNTAGEQITFTTWISGQVATVLSPLYDKEASKGISDTLRVQLKTTEGLPIAGETIYWDSYSDVRPLSKTSITDNQGIASVKCEVPFGGSIENEYFPLLAEFQGNDKYSTSMCNVQLKPGYLVKGYIEPNFTYLSSDAQDVKSGFSIEFTEQQCSVVTDKDGYFETVLPNARPYMSATISKPGFLKRVIPITAAYEIGMTLSTKEQPLEIWAGDIPVDGIQNNAVNIADIMEVAKRFNKIVEDKTDDTMDLNKDGVINIADIMIVSKSFNKVYNDYPEYNGYKTDPPVVYSSTPTSKEDLSTPVPTPTPTSGDKWVAYHPSSDQISVSIIRDTFGDFYGIVSFTFPDGGYRIDYTDEVAVAAGIMPDGSTRMSYINAADVKIEKWTGASDLVITKKSIAYKLSSSKKRGDSKIVFTYRGGSSPVSCEVTTSSMSIPTASYTVSSSTVSTSTPVSEGKWVSYQPSSDQTRVSIAKDALGNYYGLVCITFPSSGYRMNYDDQVAIAGGIMPDGSTRMSFVNASIPRVERWTGASAAEITGKNIIYTLPISKTSNNKYVFTYNNGADRVTCEFTTSSAN